MSCFRCLNCSMILETTRTRVSCPSCHSTWPVENGIPRFFRAEYYWGELPQTEANLFIREAKYSGWRKACDNRFRDNPEMLISLLDPQRASWLPLLALAPNTTALDIGCGHGAITHALARTCGQVYSVEAIPERLEFCSIRLHQEGITNVQLVQASALDLPFTDGSFDVIIVNGILEWVGEWERTGNPRSIQRHFLERLNRLLRADGKLVIGIENRFGHSLIRGGMDHSGVAYTSLMPRPLASAYLRIDKTAHHRMLLNPKREYRTYTYSQRGYKKLLAESGFSFASFYWADPGYNQPYTLVPATGSFVRRHFLKRQYGLQSTRRGWRRFAATLLSRAMPLLIGDFLILAQKDGPVSLTISNILPDLAKLRDQKYCLYTNPFSCKTVIHAFDRRESPPAVIVKVSDATGRGQASIEAEHAVLSLVSRKVQVRSNPNFAVPAPGPCRPVGRNIFFSETVAKGHQLSEFFSGHSHARLGRLEEELDKCLEVAAQFADILRGEAGIPASAAGDWQLPAEFRERQDLQFLIEDIRVRRRAGPRCVQHGDFTIENIFIEPAQNKITVIDWEHTTSDVTPLYDTFSLLISALPLATAWEKSTESRPGSLQRNYAQAFFGEGQWADMFTRLFSKACDRHAIPRDEMWQHFVEFLVLRINLFARKSPEMEREHRQFLTTVLQVHEKRPLWPELAPPMPAAAP